MQERLEAALSARYPHIKANLIGRYVAKYKSAVMTEIGRQYMLMSSTDISDGEMDFAADDVTNAAGRHTIGAKQGYIYTLMQEHASTSLVINTYTGNNITHRVSRVVFNPAYKQEIMTELKSLVVELDPVRLKALQASANVSVEVDPRSLAAYIGSTRAALESPKSDAYQTKLIRNLHVSVQLEGMVIERDGRHYLDEYWEYIDSGRMHGHGLSLQRIPKEVRHAALGLCHRYDFKAASYALLTSLALQIDPSLKTAALRDYIRYRTAIRRRVAQDVGISEGWMKEIFTAMGFGAALKDNPFNTIRKKLGQEKYHRLICNCEFMLIKQQLDQVCAVILKALGKGDFEWLGRQYSEIDTKAAAKRTKNQKLAWLYQCMESDALKLFVDSMPATYKVKLLVHDCVYLDKKLAPQHLADIAYKLQQRHALLFFEGDEIIPIGASDANDARSVLPERMRRTQVSDNKRHTDLGSTLY